MFNKIILPFLLLLTLFSCKENKNNTPKKEYIYFENGAVRREYTLVNGFKEGLMIDYYLDGKKKMERYLLHDIQVGKTIIYHKDGKSIREVQYYDDKGNRKDGDTIWYENGNIEFIAQFKNDKKNGMLSKFDTTGAMIYSANFLNDSLTQVLKQDGKAK